MHGAKPPVDFLPVCFVRAIVGRAVESVDDGGDRKTVRSSDKKNA